MKKAKSKSANPERPTALAGADGYLATGSELGELVMITSIIGDHASQLALIADRLSCSTQRLNALRADIRARKAR